MNSATRTVYTRLVRFILADFGGDCCCILLQCAAGSIIAPGRSIADHTAPRLIANGTPERSDEPKGTPGCPPFAGGKAHSDAGPAAECVDKLNSARNVGMEPHVQRYNCSERERSPRLPSRSAEAIGDNLTGSKLIETTLLERVSPAVEEIDSRELATLVARLADEYRGQDTIVLDLRRITPICDYFVITTAQSNRQMHALAEEANRAVKAHGQRRLGVEGLESSTWVLEDFGDVVLHIFNADARRLYDLEHLWSDAPRVDWKSEPAD